MYARTGHARIGHARIGNGFRRLLRERRSAVALIFSLTIVPVFLTVGGAIDYTRSVHFRSELQGAVDAAAVAGASAYVGAATSTTAQTVASTFMNNSVPALNGSTSITFSAAPSTTTSGGSTTAYLMTVTASANVATTFLGLIKPSVAVNVTATAKNPVVYGNISAGAFSANAADANSIYWYLVPSDGSIPANSALNLMWANSGGTQPSNVSFTAAASQHIGFALKNVTANYGNTPAVNAYGSPAGTVHIFYSHLNPPSNSTNGYNSSNNPSNINHVNGNGGNNCALQVLTIPSSGTLPATPTACTTTIFPYAQPTCGQLAGQKVRFDWNDMGGYPTDDADFNDAEFTLSCGLTAGGGASAAAEVTLTN